MQQEHILFCVSVIMTRLLRPTLRREERGQLWGERGRSWRHVPSETTATLSGKKCSLNLISRCTNIIQIP